MMENRPIDETSDLFCYDFDSSCRWHNIDSLLTDDDLNWFRGNGFLDRNRLQVWINVSTLSSLNTSKSECISIFRCWITKLEIQISKLS